VVHRGRLVARKEVNQCSAILVAHILLDEEALLMCETFFFVFGSLCFVKKTPNSPSCVDH
jgi:hypothetical protein